MEKASSKQYLVVDEDGKGHLPVRDSADGPLNHHLMGAAWAALHGGYRGNKYEGPGKQVAIEKLKALYHSEGMELPSLSGDREIGRSGEQPTHSPDHPITRSPDGPRFVMTLAEAPATGLIRIPIAITGKWKGAEKEFSVGVDDLNEIRENFAKKPTGEINVDYEHASEVPFGTGDAVLSAGRIVKLDPPEAMNGTGKHILWGWYEPTERAREFIQNKEYRYVSPAIRWGARDKVTGKVQGTTLTSLALVNKPFLEELPAIQAAGLHRGDAEAQSQEFPQRLSASAVYPPVSQSAVFSETVDGQKVFVSLGQLHVPGPVNQVSVAYGQPGVESQESRVESAVKSRESRVERKNRSTVDSQLSTHDPKLSTLDSRLSTHKEGKMATKSLRLKCLTAADIEKHGLPDSHKGKIGVFDGDEHIGTAEKPEGWKIGEGDGDGPEAGDTKDSEAFASEVGMAGKSLAEIAALVKRGLEAPVDQFAALAEAIHDGKMNLIEAGRLADSGRLKFSTILAAQEAERRVEGAVRAGKVLPKNRAHALKLALSDGAAFTALIEQAAPVVDLRAHGHAGGGEQPTAQQVLMGEVNAYAKEHKCSVSVALSEVTKLKPDLWRQYSEEIVVAVEAGQEEE